MIKILGCQAPAEGSGSLNPITRPYAPSRHPQNSGQHLLSGKRVFTRARPISDIDPELLQ